MEIINVQTVNFLISIDPVFDKIVQQYGCPPSWKRPEGFESLCRIILEQQVSLESGKASFEKLSLLVRQFTPAEISTLSPERMRIATVSRQKSSYILGLAKGIIEGSIHLDGLKNMTKEECFNSLTAIRGIGPWTAEVYMLFALQATDIYPRGDIALVNTIKELWKRKNAEHAYELSSQWSPYRSAASFLLWHYYLCKRGRTSII